MAPLNKRIAHGPRVRLILVATMKNVFATFVLAATLALPATAQTIGPVTIGAHRDAILKQPNQECDDKRCVFPVVSLGETTARFWVGFNKDGRVDGVIVTVDSAWADDLAAAARAKLGKPRSDVRSTLVNAFGVMVPQRHIKWTNARFVAHKNYAVVEDEAELVVMSKAKAAENDAEERKIKRGVQL